MRMTAEDIKRFVSELAQHLISGEPTSNHGEVVWDVSESDIDQIIEELNEELNAPHDPSIDFNQWMTKKGK